LGLIILFASAGLIGSHFLTDQVMTILFWCTCSGVVFLALAFNKRIDFSKTDYRRLYYKAVFVMFVVSSVIIAKIFMLPLMALEGIPFMDSGSHHYSNLVKKIYGPTSDKGDYRNSPKIYDMKIDDNSRLLYFSESKKGRIGRINLVTGDTRLSSPDFGGAEQLVLADDNKHIATYLKKNDRKTLLIDAESLQSIWNCPNIGGYMDLTATPFNRILAGVQELEPQLFWISIHDCKEDFIYLKTLFPYQVLCSEKFMACYVSGWFSSMTMTKVELNPISKRPSKAQGLFLGPFSIGMTMDERSGKLYVSRPLAGCIDVIDLSSFHRIHRIQCVPMVRAVAYSPEYDLLFLPEYFTGKVEVRKASNGRKILEFQVGPHVREIVWDSMLETLFIADLSNIYAWKISPKDLSSLNK